MKKIEFEFQQELQQQIDLLNSFYELISKQKALLEKSDYENLFITKSNFDEISKTIQQRREKLSYFENSCNSGLPQIEIREIKKLINRISDIMKKVLIIENQTCHMLQKIGEELSEIN